MVIFQVWFQYEKRRNFTSAPTPGTRGLWPHPTTADPQRKANLNSGKTLGLGVPPFGERERERRTAKTKKNPPKKQMSVQGHICQNTLLETTLLGTCNHAIWWSVCQNAAYLAAICDWALLFRSLSYHRGQGCDLGSYVAKTLRSCVCIWKAIKPRSHYCSFIWASRQSDFWTHVAFRCRCRYTRSEKLQNESSPNVLNFPPNLHRILLRIFSAFWRSFVWLSRETESTKNSLEIPAGFHCKLARQIRRKNPKSFPGEQAR